MSAPAASSRPAQADCGWDIDGGHVDGGKALGRSIRQVSSDPVGGPGWSVAGGDLGLGWPHACISVDRVLGACCLIFKVLQGPAFHGLTLCLSLYPHQDESLRSMPLTSLLSARPVYIPLCCISLDCPSLL